MIWQVEDQEPDLWDMAGLESVTLILNLIGIIISQLWMNVDIVKPILRPKNSKPIYLTVIQMSILQILWIISNVFFFVSLIILKGFLLAKILLHSESTLMEQLEQENHILLMQLQKH